MSEEGYGGFAPVFSGGLTSWEYPLNMRAPAAIFSFPTLLRQNHGSPPRTGLDVLHPTCIQFH